MSRNARAEEPGRKSQTTPIEYPGGLAGDYVIPGSISNTRGSGYFKDPRGRILPPAITAFAGRDPLKLCRGLFQA